MENLSMVFCSFDKKLFSAEEEHPKSHFRHFICLPVHLKDFKIIELSQSKDSRKLVRILNDFLEIEYSCVIYYGTLSNPQENLFHKLDKLQFDDNNLVRLYDISQNHNKTEFALRYDYYGTSLTNFRKDATNLDLKTFVNIFTQICNALLYLHQNGICHGNLELDSVFLDNESIKIGNLDKMICFEDLKNSQVEIGNDYEMAPEIIEGSMNENSENELKKLDSWNLGIFMYQFLSNGKSPFPAKDIFEAQYKIVSGQYTLDPAAVPKFAKEILKLIAGY